MSFYGVQYFTVEYQAVRRFLEWTQRGVETHLLIRVNHENGYYLWSEETPDSLIAEDEAHGRPREYWRALIEKAYAEFGLSTMPENINPRWRIASILKGALNHRYYPELGEYTDEEDYKAIRRHLQNQKEGIESTLQIQVDAGPFTKGSTFLPLEGDGILWLLSAPKKMGKSLSYWKDLIQKAKEELTPSKTVDTTQLLSKDVESELTFGLEDLLNMAKKEQWELELSEPLVDAIQRVNQPYLFDPFYKRRNRIWKATHPICKRLWGPGRHGRHGKKPGQDNGAFVKPQQVEAFMHETTLTFDQLEQNIIGVKRGICGRTVKLQLPITPNRWWAKLFGFYFSSGAYYYRIRKGSYKEEIFRLVIDDDVIPMLVELGKHIGASPQEMKHMRTEPYKFHTAKTLRSRRRPNLSFPTPILHIMRKFGLELPSKEERFTAHRGRKNASRNYHVNLPDWIRDEDCMHDFIEGYVNGMKGHSLMNFGGRGFNTHVYIRTAAMNPLEAQRIIAFMVDYLRDHGIDGHLQQMPDKDLMSGRLSRYEYRIGNRESLKRFLDTFEIRRVDMRARLLLRRDTHRASALYEALSMLNPQQIVVLGVIYEAPRERSDLNKALLMRKDLISEMLTSLQNRGLITRDNGIYTYNNEVFLKRQSKRTKKRITILRRKASTVSVRLLHQCQECSQVYINPRELCGLCGSEVEPVPRRKVLQPLHLRVMKAMRKTTTWERELDEIELSARD